MGRDRVYEGQPVLYRIAVNNVEDPSPPILEGFDDFDVESLGEQSLDSRSVTIINGRMTEQVRRGREYRYRLTPLKTGLLRIPGPLAKVNGRTIEGAEKFLQVIPAEEQDTVFLEIESSRRSVYPTQKFTLTATVTVKGLAEPNSKRSPVSVQRRQPALKVPWIGDPDDLPDGLAPESDLNDWAKPYLAGGRGGFSINGLTTSGTSIFSVFAEPESASFMPKSQTITRRDKNGQEALYWQYKFPRTFIPSKAGHYKFGPVTLEGTFITGVDDRGEFDVQQVYAMAKPIEVTVNDAPEEGRPDSYIGAIGQFQLTADLEPRSVKVGDPMTLTLTLSGEGTLENVVAPEIDAMADVARRFKIYEATEQSGAGSRRFTYGLRPRDDQIEAFPAVAVSYFDVQAGRYVTIRSDPVPIEVSQAEQLSGDQIVATSDSTAGPREVRSRSEGIIVSPADVSAVRDESIRPLRWLLALGGLLGLYAGIALITVEFRRFSGDAALVRRRGAVGKARSRLTQALTELEAQRVRRGADLMQDTLVNLVADVADLPPAGLTPKDVRGRLEELDVEETLVDRVNNLLETCDATRYGTSDQAEGLVQEAQEVIEQLIKSLKARKRFR